MPQTQLLDWVLEGLMSRYRTRVPDVSTILSGMLSHGVIADVSEIENDHIAFRTMGVPHLGIQSLEKIFLVLGYRKEDFYRFEKKKLNAYWYSPPEPRFPRVFISELCVNELSPETQAIIRSYTDGITEDPVDVILRSFAAQNGEGFKGLAPFGSPENTVDGEAAVQRVNASKELIPFGSTENASKALSPEALEGRSFGVPTTRAHAEAIDAFLHQPLWRTPTWADYQALAAESEYASWVIYNRYYLNHFTITIHNLPAGYNTVALFNDFLESLGITLNDAGGKAKISPDKKLIQSSTVAQLIDAAFDDGHGGEEIHTISGSYVEFAQREILDDYAHLPLSEIKRHHRKEGFERDNADGIFESTYSQQTGKKG